MITYAVYRLYYGADWIEESIKRTLDQGVDRVFVFFTGPILGDGTNYDVIPFTDPDGTTGFFPEDPDGAKAIVREMSRQDPRVISVATDHWSMEGQMSHFINDYILDLWEKPDAIVINECDHLWKNLSLALEVWREVRNNMIHRWTKVRQTELWRPPQAKSWWEVPHRPQRFGPIFWDMRDGPIPSTVFHGYTRAGTSAIVDVPGLVYNVGYCASESGMRWKVRCSVHHGMSGKDSMPDHDYVDGVYLQWKPGEGDLELSINFRNHIPSVTRLTGRPF